jgi:hypothetical protein
MLSFPGPNGCRVEHVAVLSALTAALVITFLVTVAVNRTLGGGRFRPPTAERADRCGRADLWWQASHGSAGVASKAAYDPPGRSFPGNSGLQECVEAVQVDVAAGDYSAHALIRQVHWFCQ